MGFFMSKTMEHVINAFIVRTEILLSKSWKFDKLKNWNDLPKSLVPSKIRVQKTSSWRSDYIQSINCGILKLKMKNGNDRKENKTMFILYK